MQDLQTTFSDIPYQRPDLDDLQRRYKQLMERCDQAATASDWNSIIHDWNELRTWHGTQANINSVRYTQNIKDEFVRGEKEFYDDNSPTVAEWDIELGKKVLASPFGDDITKEWGHLFLRMLEDRSKTFSPAIKPLMVQESKLVQEYVDLLASAQIEFQGEIYNLSGLDKFTLDSDRSVRKSAMEAKFGYYADHAAELDSIYDRLVKVRVEMAKTLGFDNYIQFRYIEMGRTDYTPEDVAVFRKQVLDTIVPITQQFRKRQAERLGLDSLSYYDEGMQFPDGNPNPQGNPDWILHNAQEMYRELSPKTGEFFDKMTSHEMMDLVTRPNKDGGGYCTSFPLYGMPFIFSNFNGTTHDVEVLTHEAGHAFQMYMSRNQKLIDYFFPTSEACEIHSMSMEFLTWPWMERFFLDQTEKFKFYHLQSALLFLPYSCTVDEFQHWVYSNPDATPAERNAMWRTIEKKYVPHRNYEGMSYLENGGFWQRQAHIYASPFYYIDYALAQICALQFWSKAEKEREAALEDYINICAVGGSMTFLEIVKLGNLMSPFEPGSMDKIVAEVLQWLENWQEEPVEEAVPS